MLSILEETGDALPFFDRLNIGHSAASREEVAKETEPFLGEESQQAQRVL